MNSMVRCSIGDYRHPARPVHASTTPSRSRRRTSAAAAGLNFVLLSTRFFGPSVGIEAFTDVSIARSHSTPSFTRSSGCNWRLRAASRSPTVEQVQPMTSVSEERRLSAVQALARQTLKNVPRSGGRKSFDDAILLTDMNDAATLLETFTQASDNGSSSALTAGDQRDERMGTHPRRMGSVPGATRMSTIRQRAAEEMGQALSPRDSPDLYRNDGSYQARWAVDALLGKLEEGMKERSDEAAMLDGIELESTQTLPPPEKRKRGRPRKSPFPIDETTEVVKLNPLQPHSAERNKKSNGEQTSLSSRDELSTQSKIPGRKSGIEKKGETESPNAVIDSPHTPPNEKATKDVTTAKLVEPIVGAKAVMARQLVKGRKKKRVIPLKSVFSRSYPEPGTKGVEQQTNVMNRNLSPDSMNLNRYYKTELLTAKEEYSLGMKVKFMVKCEAVHEGLSLNTGRNPTIAEWASACGFEDYDAEISSEDYIENELDKQIRPAGADAPELDPNMFLGNGLVNDTGVGRGKGRVKKPPPARLSDFYDDSVEKFESKKGGSSTVDNDDSYNPTDIFFHLQRKSPGEPINRGSPRLFREMMLTSKEAKQHMVQSNMRLVVSIARRYHRVGVNVQDLVQEGSLGLSRAAEKFEPKKGFKFSTYASWWIQQAVFRSIAYHSRTIRLPVHVHNLLNKVRRSRQTLQQELGRIPTNEEMAQELDMSIEKYNKMMRSTRNSISLERPKFKNNPKDLGHESEVLVGDMVDSSAAIFDEKTPEQSVDRGLLHTDIQYMLRKLGEDERIVLCLRYGINDGITRTVTLVASEMRQTKSWVRSQECRALRKLRRPWYEKRLKEHRESLQASELPTS